jgi:hypothetical protein
MTEFRLPHCVFCRVSFAALHLDKDGFCTDCREKLDTMSDDELLKEYAKVYYSQYPKRLFNNLKRRVRKRGLEDRALHYVFEHFNERHGGANGRP